MTSVMLDSCLAALVNRLPDDPEPAMVEPVLDLGDFRLPARGLSTIMRMAPGPARDAALAAARAGLTILRPATAVEGLPPADGPESA